MNVKIKFKCDSIHEFETCKNVLLINDNNITDSKDSVKTIRWGRYELSVDRNSPMFNQFIVGKSYLISIDEIV